MAGLVAREKYRGPRDFLDQKVIETGFLMLLEGSL
jgi:hypothetical protein